MKEIGKGTRQSGRFTNLGIAQQFANAAIHFLRDHRYARTHADGGSILPIDNAAWRSVLDLEFNSSVGRQ